MPTNRTQAETERIELGRALFFDTRLSGDHARSCASCHDPERGFTDGRAKARSRDGRDLRRNTQSLWNLKAGTRFYWDGRALSLADQARFPIEHPDEMNASFPSIIAALSRDQDVRRWFERANPKAPQISKRSITQALAAYVASLVSPKTKFDRWIEGDRTALSRQEYNGFRLFVGRAGCLTCHGGWRFTDDRFHDIGLPLTDDNGRASLSSQALARSALSDIAAVRQGVPAFKTPGLRELVATAPYMHDGSISSLDAVITHYTGARRKRPSVSPNIPRDLKLTKKERAALGAFLKTLSSN